MKISSRFHVLVFFMAFLIFSMPFVTFPQEVSVQAEAIAAAEADVEAHTKKEV